MLSSTSSTFVYFAEFYRYKFHGQKMEFNEQYNLLEASGETKKIVRKLTRKSIDKHFLHNSSCVRQSYANQSNHCFPASETLV